MNIFDKKRKKHIKMLASNAFTLVEVILSISLLFMVAAITTPVIVNIYNRIENQSVAEEIVSVVKKAQSQSVFNKNNSRHGIKFDAAAKKFVLFQGDLYSEIDPLNELNNLYTNVITLSPTLSGDIIIFDQHTGFSLNSSLNPINSDIQINVVTGNFTRTIFICENGLIDYETCN